MMIRTVERERRKAVWSMRRWLKSTCIACGMTAGMLAAVPDIHAQSTTLEPARALYVAAEYDDALVALDNLRASARREEIGRIEYYRALCLLALGRSTDAEAAIETAVTAEPFAQPSEADTAPRIRTAFREVRRRMLPAIIRQKYDDARAAFVQKD